jgi:hypothetical protein
LRKIFTDCRDKSISRNVADRRIVRVNVWAPSDGNDSGVYLINIHLSCHGEYWHDEWIPVSIDMVPAHVIRSAIARLDLYDLDAVPDCCPVCVEAENATIAKVMSASK